MSVPNATLLAAIVNAVAKLPEPSKSPVPVTSPVNDKVLAVASAEAVSALPVKLPVTLPSNFATIVTVVTVI